MTIGKRKRGFKALAGLALVTTMLLFLAACSGNSGSSKDSAAAPQAALNQADSAKAAQMADQMAFSSAHVSATSGSAAQADKPGSSTEVGAGAGAGFVPIGDTETGINRKVIYKAQVTMKVSSFDTATQKLRDAIHQSGGYVLEFSNTKDPNEKGAVYVIKVPADGFSSFIDQLGKIQKDMQLQMQGSDVTEEYVDLSARLAAHKVVEARLLAFMDKATKTDDLVRFSTELAKVQEQIEQLKGRMRYLDQNVSYSTVNLRLYEGQAAEVLKEESASTFGDRLIGALTGSTKVLGQFGEALLLFLAALLPVAAVAALIGVPAYLIVRGTRLARRETAADRRKEWNAGAAANREHGQPDEGGPAEDDIR